MAGSDAFGCFFFRNPPVSHVGEKKQATRSRLRYVKFDRDVGHQMEGPGPNQPQSKHALTAEPGTLWFSNYPKQDFA